MGSAGGCYYGVDTKAMTDVLRNRTFLRRVGEGFAWASGGSFVLKIIGMAITFLIIARLSLHDYGTYQLSLAAWGLSLTFFFQGINQVAIAQSARRHKDGDYASMIQLGRGLLFFKIIVGILLWTFIHFASPILSRYYSGDIIQLLGILSWTFLAIPLSEFIRFDLSSRQRFAEQSLFDVAEEFIRGAGILAALFVFRSGIEGLLWAMVISIAITPLFFLPFIKADYFRLKIAFTLRPFWQLIFDQGVWVVLQKYVRLSEKHLRLFVVQYFVGREAVALFAIAEKLLTYVMGIVPMQNILIPAISAEAGDQDRLKTILERGIKYSLPFYFLVTLAAYISAPIFLRYFFPQYLSAVPLFSILLLYAPFTGVSLILTSFFYSKQEQRAAFFAVLVRFGLFLVFAPIMLLLFGVIGIAIEYVISLYLYNVLRYASIVRIYPSLSLTWQVFTRFDSYDRAVWSRIKNRLTKRSK